MNQALQGLADRITFPIDFSSLEEAEPTIQTLQDAGVNRFKIGLQMGTRVGWTKTVNFIQERGGMPFADMKLLDIPNTVAKAITPIAEVKASMVNLHALGGRNMMIAAREAVEKIQGESRFTKILAVTILTSQDYPCLVELGIQPEDPRPGEEEGIRILVVRLARLAQECGMDGVVCSALEVKHVREACGPDFIIATPGIRLPDSPPDDQRRTATPFEATLWGSTDLIIGRPLKTNTRENLQRILEDIQRALAEREKEET